MADYDTRYGERARDWHDEDRDRWHRDQAGTGQWRGDTGDRWANDRSDRDRRDRERWDRERWDRASRQAGGSQDEHSRYYGGTYRAGQHGPDQARTAHPPPDYAQGMYEDMRQYAGRDSEDRSYGPYGSLYRRDDRDRAFEFGPYSRGSGYGGGYYGTGGGYFGTTGGGGFGGRGADSGSREYGGVREFGAHMAASGDAGNDRHRGATGYVGGYRGEDYRYGGGRHSAHGGGERGWWDRTSDEVRSWFGDDEAERRRRRDEQVTHRGRGPKGYSRSDDRIREDVSDRLTEDPHIDASEIDVTVASGEVTLSGSIDRRWAKRHAEDIAEGVSGVKHVQNNLRLNQTDWKSADSTTDAGVRPGQTASSRGVSLAAAAAGSGSNLGGQAAGSSTTSSSGPTGGRSGT